MHVATVNLSSIKNFATVKKPEDDTGLEILLVGQGLSFCTHLENNSQKLVN